MHRSFFCVMYLLVALMGLHQTVNANDQIQLSSLNTVDQGLFDQTHTFHDGDKTYWNLHVWQGKPGCPGKADKSWTDWVYHACEKYNFKQLSYNPGVEGIYRLCVYNDKDCEELIFTTSRAEDCVQVKPQWGKSWKITRASEEC
ncbi:hypothetical protein HD806DRAFT_466155 [Xylariaceae sp. AK1471]|nr:hypothetical protein HD806DRAFT_466155 [Xylariaceae sp. AK1471]